MKRYSLLFVSFLGGVACAALRIRQLRIGFEPETGLAIPGTVWPLSAAVAAVSALLLVPSLFQARTQEDSRPALQDWFSLEGTGTLAWLVCGCFALAASGVLSFLRGASPSTLSQNAVFIALSRAFPKIIGIFSIFAAICLIFTLSSARKNAAHSGAVWLLAPLCFLVVELIAVYRKNGNNPVLAAFYVETLAVAALVVSYSQLAAISLGIGRPRRYAFCTALSLTLCMCALPACTDLSDLSLFFAFFLLQFGFLFAFLRKNR